MFSTVGDLDVGYQEQHNYCLMMLH